MTRCFRRLILIVSLLMFICQPASAQDLYEWSRTHRNKTAHATPVYGMTDYYLEGQAVITLPANTYVKVGSKVDNIAYIEYLTADGIYGGGYVRWSDLTAAVVYFIDEEGYSQGMQEMQYWDQYSSYPPPGCSAMKGYEPEGYRTESKSTQAPVQTPVPTANSAVTATTAPTTPPLPVNTPEATYSSDGKATAVPPANASQGATEKRDSQNAEFTSDNEDEEMTVTRIGFATCTVERNGQEEEIATKLLTFSEDAPADKKVAYIYTPNSGECWLRAKGSDSAKTIRQCKGGTVVIVLEYSEKWTKIRYRNDEGYVRTRCLRFSGGTTPMGTGMLTYNGHGTGKTTINVRNDASKDSVVIADWKTGTQVTVLSIEDGWAEIEYRGIHGFVMEKYLTMTFE